MDEPLSAVDAQTREGLQDDLLEIWRETRKTVLFVTHDVEEALKLSDRGRRNVSRAGHSLRNR